MLATLTRRTQRLSWSTGRDGLEVNQQAQAVGLIHHSPHGAIGIALSEPAPRRAGFLQAPRDAVTAIWDRAVSWLPDDNVLWIAVRTVRRYTDPWTPLETMTSLWARYTPGGPLSGARFPVPQQLVQVLVPESFTTEPDSDTAMPNWERALQAPSDLSWAPPMAALPPAAVEDATEDVRSWGGPVLYAVQTWAKAAALRSAVAPPLETEEDIENLLRASRIEPGSPARRVYDEAVGYNSMRPRLKELLRGTYTVDVGGVPVRVRLALTRYQTYKPPADDGKVRTYNPTTTASENENARSFSWAVAAGPDVVRVPRPGQHEIVNLLAKRELSEEFKNAYEIGDTDESNRLVSKVPYAPYLFDAVLQMEPVRNPRRALHVEVKGGVLASIPHRSDEDLARRLTDLTSGGTQPPAPALTAPPGDTPAGGDTPPGDDGAPPTRGGENSPGGSPERPGTPVTDSDPPAELPEESSENLSDELPVELPFATPAELAPAPPRDAGQQPSPSTGTAVPQPARLQDEVAVPNSPVASEPQLFGKPELVIPSEVSGGMVFTSRQDAAREPGGAGMRGDEKAFAGRVFTDVAASVLDPEFEVRSLTDGGEVEGVEPVTVSSAEASQGVEPVTVSFAEASRTVGGVQERELRNLARRLAEQAVRNRELGLAQQAVRIRGRGNSSGHAAFTGRIRAKNTARALERHLAVELRALQGAVPDRVVVRDLDIRYGYEDTSDQSRMDPANRRTAIVSVGENSAPDGVTWTPLREPDSRDRHELSETPLTVTFGSGDKGVSDEDSRQIKDLAERIAARALRNRRSGLQPPAIRITGRGNGRRAEANGKERADNTGAELKQFLARKLLELQKGVEVPLTLDDFPITSGFDNAPTELYQDPLTHRTATITLDWPTERSEQQAPGQEPEIEEKALPPLPSEPGQEPEEKALPPLPSGPRTVVEGDRVGAPRLSEAPWLQADYAVNPDAMQDDHH